MPADFTKYGPAAEDPETPGARHDRRQPRRVGQVVDLARTEVARTRRGNAARLGLMAPARRVLRAVLRLPVAAIVTRGLKADGAWHLGRRADVVRRPDIRDVLWFTTWQALASTALTLLLALPAAYVFARLRLPGQASAAGRRHRPVRAADRRRRQRLPGAGRPPRAARTSCGGTAGHHGVGDPAGPRLLQLRGRRPHGRRAVGPSSTPGRRRAARVLGASPLTAWRKVTLPALAPAVAAAALMVFLFTFTSFGVVQILGGPTFSTLEVEIYRQTSEVFDLSTAAVLTLVQFAAVGAILAVHAWTVRRRETALRLVDPKVTARRPRGAGQWALLCRCPRHRRPAADPAARRPRPPLPRRARSRLLPGADRRGRRYVPGRAPCTRCGPRWSTPSPPPPSPWVWVPSPPPRWPAGTRDGWCGGSTRCSCCRSASPP